MADTEPSTPGGDRAAARARPAPVRPELTVLAPRFTVAEPAPRVLGAATLALVLGIVVSALAAAVVVTNLDPVRSRLEVGLAQANPTRSVAAVQQAVQYTLEGTAAAAAVLAVVQLLALVAVRRRSRAGRVVLVLAVVLNLVSLVVTGALLADAQVGASSGQLRLVGLAPMVHGVLLVVGAALLAFPEARAWVRRRPAGGPAQ